MPNHKTYDAENFGFDFTSVYAGQMSNPPPVECRSMPDTSVSSNFGTAGIEEIAEELRNASDNAMKLLLNTDDDDSGITAAEILERSQRLSPEMPIHPQKHAVREVEDFLSVERILNLTLERAELAVNRGIIWGASLDDHIWRPLQTDAQISHFLHGLGIRRYGNAVRWFASRVAGDPSFSVSGFFEDSRLWGKLSFADGLYDICNDHFTKRSTEDHITAVLRWHYHDIEDPPHYERLTEAMRSLAVTDNTYLRLQEICGVALHAEPSGRILYFQHYNPRIASIFTKLLGKVWSDDAVSFLGLRDHERSFRTAQVLEHPIVISGKEGESTLRDISTVLALADGDGVNTDRKNQDPFDFVSRCSLICAGRNLPNLQKSSMQTLQYYLVRVNLQGDLPENISIRELLSYTKAFTVWSFEGLHRYIANNGRFTFDEDSDLPRAEASILNFVQELITADPNGKVPASVLHEAYTSFCLQNDLAPLPKPRLVSYLKDTFQVESRTIRVPWFNEGRPVFGYVGISLSDEYPSKLNDISPNEHNPDILPESSEPDEDDDCLSSWDDGWKPNFIHCGEITV